MTYDDFKIKYAIELNEQQAAAVQTLDGAVLLLAVPGSGKTTVLVSRLGYMIFGRGIVPENILTVTYTVAATTDMRRRFEKKFGREYASRLEFRTINGISQKILQYYGRLTGKKPFQVADKEATVIAKGAFRAVTGSFATENDIKTLQLAITYVKNMRLQSEAIEKLDLDIDHFPEIYKAYQTELRKQRMIDYDDQMVYAIRILEQFSQILNYFRDKYHYICVDEAQDTSKIQHDMIRLLAGNEGNLFMVGDEDQSIYGFRAAYPQALTGFEQSHPNARVLLMEKNYRSCEEIVKAADELIQANENRHEKHMQATRSAGGKVEEIQTKTRENQYRYLLKAAADCHIQTAILYRNNESALPLIDLLEREGFAYRMKQKDMTYFSHPVVRDIRDFIQLSLDPYDTEAFMRIYYKMGAGISKVVAAAVIENNRRKKGLLEQISDRSEASSYTKNQCRILQTHFRHMQSENAGKAIYRILHYMGYWDYMQDKQMDVNKAEILQLLGQQEDDLSHFPGRLDELEQIISAGTNEKDSPFILSTIHSSKGLEYDRVFMIDMMDGILPSCSEPDRRKADPAELAAYEEERRLYYVGMTRAKDQLYIFTFDEMKTSPFSKTVFHTKSLKNPGTDNIIARRSLDKPSYQTYTAQGASRDSKMFKEIEQFDQGVIVIHKKFGRGVIVSREDDLVQILFDSEKASKRLSLTVMLKNHLLKPEE